MKKTKEWILPIIQENSIIVFPGMVIQFDIREETAWQAVEAAMLREEKAILLFDVKEFSVKNDLPGDMALPSERVGMLIRIKQVNRIPGSGMRILVQGIARVSIEEIEKLPSGVCEARAYEMEKYRFKKKEELLHEACKRELLQSFADYCKEYPKLNPALSEALQKMNQLEQMMDIIASGIAVSVEYRYGVLAIADWQKRLEYLLNLLQKEIKIAQIRKGIYTDISQQVEKRQRKYLLQEQLSYIQKELGEEEEDLSDAAQWEKQLKKIKATKEVKEKIEKEIRRFKILSGSSSESAVERAYIETLLEMPWDEMTKDSIRMDKAKDILERDHYGLEKVKERILEYLAVRALTKEGDSPILCLVGPPGTGKTSIAKSVAEALARKYVRVCLGGVRDEAEIRGHRKTYIGAMPGRICSGLRQAGVKNPLMLLDEIDKMSQDYKGDTASAMLEVLDPEQNCHFRDHYLDIPVDLSKVLFIATANDAGAIPRPLLDRMEIIEVTSYTANEKFHIAKNHLLPKVYRKNGMEKGEIHISDKALELVISGYTKEAGVRELERKLGQICRKAAMEILHEKENPKGKSKKTKTITVTEKNMEAYLGKRKYAEDKIEKGPLVGMVRGLAWTSVGGDTLEIEVAILPGKGELILTGQLGDVMKESAKAGITYLRSILGEYGVKPDFFKKNDIHIHIPEGAVPKDGPSAGITMATAVLSAITKIPVSEKIAMTGEISIRGRVLPVGGLKEKILAAKMAGIKTVILPKKNQKDVEEIAAEIKKGMKFVWAENMEQVRQAAIEGGLHEN